MLKFSEWLMCESTKQDFFALAKLQRDRPEHAMLAFQKIMSGGIMSSATEHIGDLIHRMSEPNTFHSAGYEFVKEKVQKTLSWLTNGYGFEREFNDNIRGNAKYLGFEEQEYREKIIQSLELYALAHEQLPTYNRAQRLAKIAAVSLGRRKYNNTIAALKMLWNHLGSRDVWIDFAHEGLIS